MIKILGHRVLIKVDELEEMSKGGIVICTDVDKERQKLALCTGTVVGVGSTAYKEFDDGKPWCKVGDSVYFQKYGGLDVNDEGTMYRIVNDEDVFAVRG